MDSWLFPPPPPPPTKDSRAATGAISHRGNRPTCVRTLACSHRGNQPPGQLADVCQNPLRGQKLPSQVGSGEDRFPAASGTRMPGSRLHCCPSAPQGLTFRHGLCPHPTAPWTWFPGLTFCSGAPSPGTLKPLPNNASFRITSSHETKPPRKQICCALS